MSESNPATFDPQSLTSAPLQFDVEKVLHGSIDDVFNVIVDFPRMPEWMPLMKRVEVDNHGAEAPGEVGSVRVIYPPVGKATLEKVKAFERPWLLSYGATDESLMGMYTNHTGILTCEERGEGNVALRWRTYAEPGKNPLMRLLGRLIFPFVVNSSMNKLQKRFSANGA